MRMLLAAVALALSAAAAQPPPFLLTLTDPTNSHFAKQSLGRDVPAAVRRLLSAQGEVARVEFGPEVDSPGAARDRAAKEQARFHLFARCGLVIELLRQCDAHIRFCAHQCEAWLYQTDSGQELGHARVTAEKGGTDAVRKLIAQLPGLLEPLRDPIQKLVEQERAEREARATAEHVRRELAKAEAERRRAEERARKAVEKEERQHLAAAQKALREAITEAQRKAAQERLEAERRARDQARAAAREKVAEQEAREREDRLRAQAAAADRRLAAESEKRVALERAQASRVIHLVPNQTVAVLEVENDLTGGARSQVNLPLLTDNLRARVRRSGLGLLVMDRDATFQILAAHEKEVLQCLANCETHLGRILKSDYVISGRLGRQGAAFRLSLLMYRSHDGALLSDAVATSDGLAGLDRNAAVASTDLLSVFPQPR